MCRQIQNTVERANRTVGQRYEYVRDAALALIEEHKALADMEMTNAERVAFTDSPLSGLMTSIRMYERAADLLFRRHREPDTSRVSDDDWGMARWHGRKPLAQHEVV